MKKCNKIVVFFLSIAFLVTLNSYPLNNKIVKDIKAKEYYITNIQDDEGETEERLIAEDGAVSNAPESINPMEEEHPQTVSIDEEKLDSSLEALKATVTDFFNRGDSIQFNDKSVTYHYKYSNVKMRARYDNYPEDLTPQNLGFAVCSYWAVNVYSEAFSDKNGNPFKLFKDDFTRMEGTSSLYGISKSTSPDYDEKMAVYYIENNRGVIESRKDELKTKIKSLLKPGDIIVFRRLYSDNTRGAHTVIYLGDDKIVYSSGASYALSTKTEKLTGGLITNSLENEMLTAKEGKLFNASVISITIFRPLNVISERNSNYKISNNAVQRVTYKDLVRNKLSSTDNFDSVNPGDEITYTIKLENKSNTTYNNVVISEKIPNNTTLFKAYKGPFLDKGTLKWTVNIPAKESVEVSYTVKVNNDDKLIGTKIISDKGVGAGLHLRTIETLVARTLVDAEQAKIKSDVLSKNGSDFNSTEAFLNSIYPDLTFPSADNVLREIFSFRTIDFSKTYKNRVVLLAGDDGPKDIAMLKKNLNTTIGKMFVKNFWGGIYAELEGENDNPTRYDGRPFYYDGSNFTPGDILVVYDDDATKAEYLTNNVYSTGKEKEMYLYIDSNSFATVKNGKVVVFNEAESNRLIESLFGQNAFAVIRPSYVLAKYEEPVVPKTTVPITTLAPIASTTIPTTTQKNPSTGISNYYMVIMSGLVIAGVLYALTSHKNIFKKI